MVLITKINKFLRVNGIFIFAVAAFVAISLVSYKNRQRPDLSASATSSADKETKLLKQLVATAAQLKDFQNQDQYVINKKLEEEIANIQKTYKQAVSAYEQLLELKDLTKKTESQDKLFTESLMLLSNRNYASAAAKLSQLTTQISAEKEKLVAAFKPPENLPQANAPPSSGYRRQLVATDVGSFMVDIVTVDLNSAKAVVDTASEGDCGDNCPVLSLGDYVARSGAFAGINGSYFCPASYPSCAGKTNSFDTLLMNKNKKYFNSDNNVYSVVPAVIFLGNTTRFVARSLEWGRDTGVDAVLANQPLLLMNNEVMFGGDGDPKKGSKGGRSFVAGNGNTSYIGVVHNATVAESARVLKALGVGNAINLDDGGSTALWFSGYKAGPGRNIPNALLFVRR